MRESIIKEAGRKLVSELRRAGIDMSKCYIELSWGFLIIDKETGKVLAESSIDGTFAYDKKGNRASKKLHDIVHFALIGYGRSVYSAYMGKSNYCESFRFMSRNGQIYIVFDNKIFPFKNSDLEGVDFRLRESSACENNSPLFIVME